MKHFKLIYITCIIFFSLYIYDLKFGNNDGIIKLVYFNRVFIRIFILALILSILLFYRKRKNSFVGTLSYNLIFGVFFIFIFEIMAFYYLKSRKEENITASYIMLYDNPSYLPAHNIKNNIYGDINPYFGRWRKPNVEINVPRCGDSIAVNYRMNSVGARDIERTKGGPNRVVFIGDSFSEGVLMHEKDRLSNRLEALTGKEHLNFSVIGANPVFYYQIYENLVKNKFEHNSIFVGVFVGNDFDSFKNNKTSKFLSIPNYRPYWKNKSQVSYTLKNVSQSFENYDITKRNEQFRVLRDSIYSKADISQKIKIELETNSNIVNLIYYLSGKMSKERQNLGNNSMFEAPPINTNASFDFLNSFDNLVSNAKGKNIALVLIPDLKDILAFKKTKINKLTPFLKNRYASSTVVIIDLLQMFSDFKGNPEDLFIKCDGHWNEKANELAAQYLTQNIEYKNTIMQK